MSTVGSVVDSNAARAQEEGDREGSSEYRAPRVAVSLADFDVIKQLGDGSFSEVFHVRRKMNGKEYALKMIDKHLIIREKKQSYVAQERKILDIISYDGVAALHFTFQDASSLYLGLEVCPGGELFEQIRKKKTLTLEDTQFYAAEIVLILEQLKRNKVVHRDLKPENLLLAADGHLKLIDFGSAKLMEMDEGCEEGSSRCLTDEGSSLTGAPRSTPAKRRCSLNGTADYVAPEVLRSTDVGYAADLWALGCLIYQMLVGTPPFRDRSEYLTFERITAGDYSIPEGLAESAVDIIQQLLQMDAEKRLGSDDIASLKAHPFFDGIDWEGIRQQTAPSFIPPTEPNPSDLEQDWELQSMRAKMQGNLNISAQPRQNVVYRAANECESP